MPGTWSHLAGRFTESIRARRLTEDERRRVAALIPPALADAWFEQSVVDQRHGWESASSVLGTGASDELAMAALVHDIGKRHAGLGVMGRSLVSALSKLGLPTGRRGQEYLSHGELGAVELEAAGIGGIAVDFARHHHGTRPDSIDSVTWRLLQQADGETAGRGGTVADGGVVGDGPGGR